MDWLNSLRMVSHHVIHFLFFVQVEPPAGPIRAGVSGWASSFLTLPALSLSPPLNLGPLR